VTATAVEAPLRADIRRYSKHQLSDWVRPFTIGLVLVAVLAGAGARIGYAATYQPLEFGSGGYGPFTADAFKPVSDGFETTRWLLVAKPGTTATFEYAIANNGDDPVTLYDVPPAPDDWIQTSMAWEPLRNGATVQKLPVVIKPHQSVELLYSIRKPSCAGEAGFTTLESVTLHYRAFGFSHTVEEPLQGWNVQPIVVCWASH
jgi:hypothetical protein